ncbi:MAG: hypothetical protein JWQ38_2495 [Flavipsychrobacter sp.]|nr:hypothetical protein [Flavipsychrobacter sp.]
MKKYLYLLLVGLTLSFCVQAAPGDTTWVQGNITYLDGYGNYDSMLAFPAPGTTYRKIYMIFTLGKHTCPTGSTWCGDWDYTVQNYLMVPGGDTMELGRFITPYANAGAPRTPFSWLQHYVYDVTDYASVLHDAAAVRIAYSGYSGGFTADIKFAFIEGTPERNVLSVKKLWGGSYGYGGTPDINSNFPALTETPPSGTAMSEVKFTVTGHGSDGNGCCEFAPHNYQVVLNGSNVSNTTIWRDNCGLNNLYPQSGTWIYNRGNWCPGAIVYSNFHNLPGLIAGTPYTVGLTFDPYTGGGSYTTEATLIDYGAINKTLDASLDDIIAPTNNENHFRANPIAGSPIVHVRNTGSAVITSMTFQYGIQDSAMQTYNWTGTLNPSEESDITLGTLFQLDEVTGVSGTFNFAAKIVAVNGISDDDATNNTMSTAFTAAPRWPSSFKFFFRTNNEPSTTGGTISETSWIVYDANNTIVAQRTNAALSTYYTDTLSLPAGLYKLVIYDSSCDGLNWWVHASSGDGITAGSFFARQLTGANIPMNGYSYSGTYAHDFGCQFVQYFYTGTPVPSIDHTLVNNVSNPELNMEIYPNPAQNMIYVDVNGIDKVTGTVQIIDALGRVVAETACNTAHKEINVSSLVNGVYSVQFINKESGNRLVSRLLIAK